MRKLILVLILMASSALAACGIAAQQQAQQAEQARIAALAKQMLDEANRYCVETGQKPGTQLYSNCVNTNAMQRAVTYKMMQMAANPAPVYAPAPAYQPPQLYPNTAAGNFAAGLTGGSVYASPSSPPPRAPITCNTFGNTTTCQ